VKATRATKDAAVIEIGGGASRLADALLGAGYRAISVLERSASAPDGPEKCSGLPVQGYDGKSLAAELGAEFEPVETRGDVHVTPWASTQSFQFSRFRKAVNPSWMQP
jgi:hypothetical protein